MCKRGTCIIEAQEAAAATVAAHDRREQYEAYIRNTASEEAIALAKMVLRNHKKPLSRENIKLVSQKREVQAAAKRLARKRAQSVFEK